jgi:hypothetical protein
MATDGSAFTSRQAQFWAADDNVWRRDTAQLVPVDIRFVIASCGRVAVCGGSKPKSDTKSRRRAENASMVLVSLYLRRLNRRSTAIDYRNRGSRLRLRQLGHRSYPQRRRRRHGLAGLARRGVFARSAPHVGVTHFNPEPQLLRRTCAASQAHAGGGRLAEQWQLR